MEMKKRFFRVSLVVLLVAWLSWALSSLWKPVVYGYAPGVLVNFIGYDRDLSGPDGTQPYLLLGVILQLKEDAIAEGRKRIPAGLQL